MGACSGCFAGLPGGKAQKEIEALKPKFRAVVKIRNHLGVDNYLEFDLTEDQTIKDLELRLWEKENVHPNCQTLMAQGREMSPDDTIKEIIDTFKGIEDHNEIRFDCSVDLAAFPQKLGPFSVASVPFQKGEIHVPVDVNNPIYQEKGFYWDMSIAHLEQHEISAPGTHVTGQASRMSTVSVEGTQRKVLLIPEGAVQFAWSYPIAHWQKVTKKDPTTVSEDEIPRGVDAIINFFRVGGYLYFNSAGELVGATTLCRYGCDDGTVHFGKPKRLKPEWVEALAHNDRFQKVTVEGLKAHYFCWMPHGDKLKGPNGKLLASQPAMPIGGFAYLIDDMPGHGAGVYNCYFPMKVQGLVDDQVRRTLRENAEYVISVSKKSESKGVLKEKITPIKLSGDPTHHELQQAVWRELYVHPSVQSLQYKGREMQAGDTLQSFVQIRTEDFQNLQLTLEYDHGAFPQKLGPFSVSKVDFPKGSFNIPEKGEGKVKHWELQPAVLDDFGLEAWGQDIQGQLSPLSRITLESKQRVAAMIPAKATQFAFSYPACDTMSKQNKRRSSRASVVQSFLKVGGFMYFDDDLNVVGTTTLGGVDSGESGGLNFGHPKKLKRSVTKALVQQGRFQKVTIKELRDGSGCMHFCWLPPMEKIDGDEPMVPHGGFAYLFHEDPNTCKGAQAASDCYFPIKGGGLAEEVEVATFRNFVDG